MSDRVVLLDAEVVTELKQVEDQDVDQCYTVEEVVEKMGFGYFQILLLFFCGLMLIADSMELMLLSVLSPAVKCEWGLSTTEEALITTVLASLLPMLLLHLDIPRCSFVWTVLADLLATDMIAFPIVFFGFLLGGMFWGSVCDKIGRKKGLLLVTVNLFVCGLLSALPVSRHLHTKFPNYPWLLLCRFGVGIGAGGSCQSVTYYTEFLPTKSRGIFLVLQGAWWVVGTVFGAVLAWMVMTPLGWRWMLFIASIPMGLVLLLFLFFPESARYHVVHGERNKAKEVIQKIAWYNRKTLPEFSIVTVGDREKRKGVKSTENSTVFPGVSSQIHSESEESDEEQMNLVAGETEEGSEGCLQRFQRVVSHQFHVYLSFFKRDMLRTTTLLLVLWIGCGWLYYGIVLLTTVFLQYDSHCGQTLNETGSMICKGLATEDYSRIVWTSVAEAPGLLIATVTVNQLGRKKSMAIQFLGTGIGFLLLFICAGDSVLTLFLFIIRAFAVGVFQTIYVYTPEVYPTSVRGAAIGIHTSGARIGAMTTPFVAQVLLHISDYTTIALYASSSLLLVIVALLLPIETKGRSLQDG